MTLSRRELVQTTGLLAVGALTLPTLLESCVEHAAKQTEALPVRDQATLDFWTSTASTTRSVRGDATDPDVEPEFVFFDSDAKQFLDVTALAENSTKLPAKGTWGIVAKVERFRPSANDVQRFRNLKTGSLRVDVGQHQKSPEIGEALAWSALGALFPSAKGELPALQDLQFDPGTAWGALTSVPLPKGSGFWSWNFFLQQKESFWSKLVDFFRQTSVVFPVILGLPAIAVPGLQQLSNFLGQVVSRDQTDWLFKSRQIEVFTTQEGKDQIVGEALVLRTGSYFIVPQRQLGVFHGESANLDVQRGLLVPKGTSSLDAFDASKDVLNGVTYLSVAVKVVQQDYNIAGSPVAAVGDSGRQQSTSTVGAK